MKDVRVGILGRRGLAYAAGLRSVEGVRVTALAELDPVAREEALRAQDVEQAFDSYEAMLEVVDAVVVATPMHLHADQAVLALEMGKHVLSEVTAAVSMEECRRLRHSAERSSALYGFAENYCYSQENLLILELVRQGLFGELYFGEGEYVHEVRFLHRTPGGEPTWRMRWQVGVPGNTYCTHELGPVMRWFRAHDPSLRIVSVACFGTGVHTDPSLNHDDCTLTMVKLSNGGLIKLRLDMVSNRPERIAYSLQGVNGVYESDDGGRVWFGPNATGGWDGPHREWRPLAEFRKELHPDLAAEIDAAAEHGHGGGDYFVGRRFVQSVLGQRPLEMGSQEGIEWTMAGLLSQQSMAEGGRAIPMPDWVYGHSGGQE